MSRHFLLLSQQLPCLLSFIQAWALSLQTVLCRKKFAQKGGGVHRPTDDQQLSPPSLFQGKFGPNGRQMVVNGRLLGKFIMCISNLFSKFWAILAVVSFFIQFTTQIEAL